MKLMRVIRFDRYRLDRAQGLWRDGDEIRLTPKSLSVLCVLADRAGDVVSKDELFRTIWPDTAVSDSALTTCIQELRQALGDDARRPQFIETLHRRGYRFRAQTSHESGADAPSVLAPPPNPTASPIVGRESAIAEMLDACGLAERGTKQVLFVTGEAGIGKTTLLQAFRERLVARGPVRTTWGQCVQHYGVGEPYQPLLDALSRLCRQPEGYRLIPVLERYSPTWLAQLPALLEPERLDVLRRTSAGTTRERMLRELTDAMEAITAQSLLVLWLEDLHWSDMSTLDWIAAFAQRPEPARLLLIGTFRPHASADFEHPLTTVADALRMKAFSREITLRGLDEAGVGEYVALRFPPAPGHGEELRRLARLIHQHTGGNPLFVSNLLDDLAARKQLVAVDGRWKVTGDVNRSELGIPDDVRRMIARQVDRLQPIAREALEIASVAGTTFSTPAVAAATGFEVAEVETTLASLARQNQFVREAGPLEWPDGTVGTRFDFLHVLYRDVLYQRVAPGRRAQLHRHVGNREEAAYGARAPEIAAELAMHFERSGDLARAGTYLQHAAANARRRSAYGEAQLHFDRALTLLASQVPSPERSARELELQLGRGAVIMAARGWSALDAVDAYSRARALSHELGDTPQLFPALWGLWLYYWGRGPLSAAQELVHELLGIARQHADDVTELQAHHAAWATAFCAGDLEATCGHAADGTRLYHVDRHAVLAATYGSHDAGMCCRNFGGWAFALRGRSGEADRASREALDMSRRLGHPFSLALTHFFAAANAHARRDVEAVRTNAAAAVAVAREQDFRLVLAWALALEGWAAVEHGHVRDGMDQIADAIVGVRETGANQFIPYLLGVKAESLLKHGAARDGLNAVAAAFDAAESTGERFWLAELHRLHGELQLAANEASATREAEQAFLTAIDLAERQQANLLALRAALSLGRLWRHTGRDAEARRRVAAARADLVESAELLDVIEASAFLARDPGCR
jgi:DNA-binding winged helix-turn-helix (wHTH) protein/predicted ATPase